MSTPNTRRKARDIALQLLSDVNDKQTHRFFKVNLDLNDETEMQIADDLMGQMFAHGAPILSHSVQSVMGERQEGVQKVCHQITFVCKIEHEPTP